MKRGYGFGRRGSQLRQRSHSSILAINVEPALFFIWPIVAIATLVIGVRSTTRIGVTVDRTSRILTVNNWMKSVVIPFADILELSRTRIHVQAGGLYGAPKTPLYRPAVALNRTGFYGGSLAWIPQATRA